MGILKVSKNYILGFSLKLLANFELLFKVG